VSAEFEPCDFLEHDGGLKSLCFSNFESFIDLLESKGGQGGGYSWEALVKAVMAMRALELPDLEFDPEGDMFCVVSHKNEPLMVVASIVRELCADSALMSEAIDKAIAEGYFE
jgi:hypothetical protein